MRDKGGNSGRTSELRRDQWMSHTRWLSAEQKSYGKDANFTRGRVTYHTRVKSNDYLFTPGGATLSAPKKWPQGCTYFTTSVPRYMRI